VSEPTRRYELASSAVEWRPELCVHCGTCIGELPSVFDMAKRPWVNVKGASEEAIIAQVGKCPGGALSMGPKQREGAVA